MEDLGLKESSASQDFTLLLQKEYKSNKPKRTSKEIRQLLRIRRGGEKSVEIMLTEWMTIGDSQDQKIGNINL